jgi:chromosome segregation ATPase
MANFLTEAQIEEKDKFIEETEKEIKELEKKHQGKKDDIQKAQSLINDFNEKIKEQEIKIRGYQADLLSIKEEHTPLPPKVKHEKDILAKDAFDKKVKGYVDEAIGFYDCLKDRLKRKQEEYKATMDDYFTFIEPEDVVQTIKADIENNRAFSMPFVNLRGAKGKFDATTRELCTMKAKGEKPNIHMAKKQMSELDTLLESQDVIHRWHIEKRDEDRD